MNVEVPKGVGGQTRNMMERCMASCERAAGIEAKGDPRARKKKHQFKKKEDTTNSLLNQNIWSTDPEMALRFLISST